MDDQPKIIPCTLCGGDAHYQPDYGLKCSDCGAKVPCRHSYIHDLWNTRTPIAEAAE